MPHSTSLPRRRRSRSMLRALHAPFAPRRNVIRPNDSNHNPAHTMARGAAASERWPRWADRGPQHEPRDHNAPRVMPGATPTKPSVSRRNGCSSVTPTARVAPGWILPPGRVKARRRRPPVGIRRSASTARVHAARTRGAATIHGIVGQHIIRACSPASRLRRFRSAPRCAGLAAWTPAPRALRNGQLSDDARPRPCHTTTARSRCPVRRDSGRRSSFLSRRRVSLPAGPQKRTRTVGRGSHPERAGAERRTCGACGAG